MLKKPSMIVMICLLFTMLGGGIASAHVTVLPSETVQGTYEKFAVRVPTEKDIPTVKVEVKIPIDSVSISRFEPKPGWKYDLTKDASGKITSVTWTATGDGLSATEFGEFYMQGKVADNASSITWKAYQTYKDGSIVEWVGANGSDKPASVTKVSVKPDGAATDSHGNTAASAGSTAGGGHDGQPAAAPAASQTPLYLSIIALILGIIALIVSVSKKKASR
ncbi:YcnI family copper-binding membrane protein [Paenibacillus doosanensis]|uniref:YcnI family copper-binding membrane protein n=1 Tax=Paenibacillus doosanensis TaxID=1229154 RepID=UPI0021807B6D|nr:YcnI family protein [Paenibacillus doosanensis]